MTSVLEKRFILCLCFIKMKSFIKLILNTLIQTTSSIPSSVYGQGKCLWVGFFYYFYLNDKVIHEVPIHQYGSNATYHLLTILEVSNLVELFHL